MKQIILVPEKKAALLIPKINDSISYYYLNDDYACFLELKEKFENKIDIRNLSGIFDEVFQEIKEPFLELITNINKKYHSFEWWGNDLASRSPGATPLLLNITYLFSVKKILASLPEKIGFIVCSRALSNCIKTLAIEEGFQVRDYQVEIVFFGIIKRWILNGFRILRYFKEAIQRRKAAIKCLTPLPAQKTLHKKRIIIRSWFTENTFDKVKIFKDRNFGPLPEWLLSRNYEVWILPMFFNLSSSFETVFTFMKKQDQLFILPEHYLKLFDYFELLYSNYKTYSINIENASIGNTDLTSLFNEAVVSHLFSPPLLNLCNPMLKRLKEKGFEIDGFYYSFENNTPEKQFILSCRKYFRESKLIAFQHTTFFPNQLAYHLGHGESEFHPLPDKIVCSGPIYLELLEKSRFPNKILAAGPNLRFGAVHKDITINRIQLYSSKKALILPLTFGHDLAFELLLKVKETIENSNDYQVYIRSHPLLSKNKLKTFLERIGFTDYEFADDGIIQEWLPQMHAMILTGCSITTLEAVVMGVPVIRLVPDNTFSYDSFAGAEYPLEPVNTVAEIKKQLKIIEHLLVKDSDTFTKIAERILPKYFSKPNDKNLEFFL